MNVFAMNITKHVPFISDNLQSNDMEMREMLKRVWPKITKKTLDRVIPKRPKGDQTMYFVNFIIVFFLLEKQEQVI